MNSTQQNEIDFSMIGSSVINLLILSVLKERQNCTPNEILDCINQNRISGISYAAINRQLPLLVSDGFADKISIGRYSITKKGMEESCKLHSYIEDVMKSILNFDTNIIQTGHCNHKANPDQLAIFKRCQVVKILPYTLESFDDCDEDAYFLTELPANEYVYEFNNKGIGITSPGTLIAFRNSSLIKFIGILETYDADERIDGCRFMVLRQNSVFKLTVPITEDDIRKYIDKNFHFIRNKQTFSDENQVSSFLQLLQYRL